MKPGQWFMTLALLLPAVVGFVAGQLGSERARFVGPILTACLVGAAGYALRLRELKRQRGEASDGREEPTRP